MFTDQGTVLKQLKVTISGKQYTIATDEQDQDVYSAAQLVDTLLKSKASFNNDKAILIVALQLATDVAKYQKSLQSCEQKIAQLLTLLTHAV